MCDNSRRNPMAAIAFQIKKQSLSLRAVLTLTGRTVYLKHYLRLTVRSFFRVEEGNGRGK